MGYHRTPNQLLQEAMEKVNALRVKVAQHNVMNDPRMKSLTSDEQAIKKELSKALRWLDPEKGLENRISKLQAQIKGAIDLLANATQIQDRLQNELATIQEKRQSLALELSDGMEMEG